MADPNFNVLLSNEGISGFFLLMLRVPMDWVIASMLDWSWPWMAWMAACTATVATAAATSWRSDILELLWISSGCPKKEAEGRLRRPSIDCDCDRVVGHSRSEFIGWREMGMKWSSRRSCVRNFGQMWLSVQELWAVKVGPLMWQSSRPKQMPLTNHLM